MVPPTFRSPKRFCYALYVTHVTSAYVRSIRLKPGHYSSLTAPNLQPKANQERDDQYANQHYSRKLLMMGMVVPRNMLSL